MKKITSLREIWDIELGILDYVADVCKKNCLRWSIGWGTLLGAVRHKGFIPWDDDIDIVLPRPDYQKLLTCLKNNNQGRYKMMCCQCNCDYYFSFMKVIDTRTVAQEKYVTRKIKDYGIYIDIFAFDGMPSSDMKRINIYKKANFLNRFAIHVYIRDFPNVNIAKRIVYFFAYLILQPFGATFIAKKIEKFAKRYKYEECDYVTQISQISSATSHVELFPKMLIEPFVELEFMGRKLPAIKGYHTWLSMIYGDYMKLPPKEKRQVHIADCWWKDWEE